jgi:argininosuccinate lyase
MKKPWGGRFSEEINKFLEAFSESISFDKELAFAEIKASRIYAQALRKAGLLTEEELYQILQGLSEIEEEIKQGTFPFRIELEDIHMHVEKALAEKIGDVAYKLHTGRSRNEQVVADERIYIAERLEELKALLVDFILVILDKAEEYFEVVMPGFTHLQHAQPVLFSHWVTTYAEMMRLHLQRCLDFEKRLKQCPLGSSAFAGCGFPLDREFMAKALSFYEPTRHSVYAVSSRDFISELLFILSLIMVDLSRLSEEVILWTSEEFCFASLPDRLTTGSSIMPQKKNPDPAELIRGKSAIVIGNLFQMLTLQKGLPLSYNRDLQEDKPPLFQALNYTLNSLRMATLLVKGLKLNAEKISEHLKHGYLLATELADYLVLKGVPFRKAHHVVGEIVRYAEGRKKELAELSLDEYKKFHQAFEEDVYEWLTVEHALSRRNILGGTGKRVVKEYIERLRSELKTMVGRD